MRGVRIPNFSLPAQGDRLLLFYELAHGVPLLLGASGAEWSADHARRFAAAVHARAAARGLQSVVLVGEPAAIDDPPAEAATAVDADGHLRARLFGAVEPSEGAVHALDPNLRVVDGAAIEASALASDALERGLDALMDACLGELEQAAAADPSAAPVLVVPRVLAPEVCRGLVERFAEWSPAPSPMPFDGKGGTAVDPDRKRRLDAWIGDAALEQELMRAIAQRVLPELDKAFHFRADRFERVKLVCYPAREGGHFGAHRDNTAPSTRHRRFALTLNLNAGSYEGGALAFPEYGPRCAYDVAAGSAILFSCTHAHRVLPVTRGERYALISFAFTDEDATRAGRADGSRATE